MTKEEKKLLLKDLFCRLPYGVKIEVTYSKDSGSSLRSRLCCEGINTLDINILWLFQQNEIYIKPYLFPLENITEEQEDEWYKLHTKPLLERLNPHTRKEDLMLSAESLYVGLEWLNRRYLDYEGLIPMGLAKDATGLNIY